MYIIFKIQQPTWIWWARQWNGWCVGIIYPTLRMDCFNFWGAVLTKFKFLLGTNKLLATENSFLWLWKFSFTILVEKLNFEGCVKWFFPFFTDLIALIHNFSALFLCLYIASISSGNHGRRSLVVIFFFKSGAWTSSNLEKVVLKLSTNSLIFKCMSIFLQRRYVNVIKFPVLY